MTKVKFRKVCFFCGKPIHRGGATYHGRYGHKACIAKQKRWDEHGYLYGGKSPFKGVGFLR